MAQHYNEKKAIPKDDSTQCSYDLGAREQTQLQIKDIQGESK